MFSKKSSQNCANMGANGNLVAKGDEALSPLSPENFHVSLASLILGHDPVVPSMSPSPETRTAQALSTEEETGFGSEESQQGVSSEEACYSEDFTPAEKCCGSGKPCKKHRSQKDKRVRNTGKSDSEVSTSGDETSGNGSSADLESKEGKTNMAKAESLHTFSNPPSDVESSAKYKKASTSTDTPKCDLSNAGQSTDNDDSGWTVSEDAQLRGMKEDDRGPTWVEISQALGRPKKEVQLHWKVLKNHPRHSDAENEGEKEGEDRNDYMSSTKGKGKGKAAKKKQDSKQRKGIHPPAASSIRSGDFPSSSSSSDSDLNDGTFTGSASNRRQKRYMHKHVHSALYGHAIYPEPDQYFSQRDCDVLATIESKYKQGKYLEMQANFHNVTGRMIPLSIIRSKCEHAEQETRGRAKVSEPNQNKRVEDWVTSVNEYEPERPVCFQ